MVQVQGVKCGLQRESASRTTGVMLLLWQPQFSVEEACRIFDSGVHDQKIFNTRLICVVRSTKEVTKRAEKWKKCVWVIFVSENMDTSESDIIDRENGHDKQNIDKIATRVGKLNVAKHLLILCTYCLTFSRMTG